MIAMDAVHVRRFLLAVEVDSDYDDPDSFNAELTQAMENEEDVTVSVAGKAFHVKIVTYRGPLVP